MCTFAPAKPGRLRGGLAGAQAHKVKKIPIRVILPFRSAWAAAVGHAMPGTQQQRAGRMQSCHRSHGRRYLQTQGSIPGQQGGRRNGRRHGLCGTDRPTPPFPLHRKKCGVVSVPWAAAWARLRAPQARENHLAAAAKGTQRHSCVLSSGSQPKRELQPHPKVPIFFKSLKLLDGNVPMFREMNCFPLWLRLCTVWGALRRLRVRCSGSAA